MDVREPESAAEVRAGRELTVRAWAEGYGDLLSPDALSTIEEVMLDQDFEQEHAEFTGSEVDNRALVAVADDGAGGSTTVVGWATLVWDDEWTGEFVGDDEAELRACYVDPEHQGAGVGGALVEAVLSRVPTGYDRLVLEAFEAHDESRAFYEGQGFEPRATGEIVVVGESNPSVVYAREC
ncbi:GNAT family N-acetyltransferase [Halorubrum sp. SS7]|uniref:GNAT family N-acetyltransferase n=1 Tax=Halorubrum salinarum TaxID=2739057 RepID=A0A7D4BZN2_9EURY|nr:MULTISPECIES: GNAT family N-acetyltransferase [Halorubrum]QKG91816.1 GNAT family N-acetyltransferase [Halorubrum salinarum]TKX56837.1 GNAT family N-acetyltransferase [Halorubrum sp. SS7]